MLPKLMLSKPMFSRHCSPQHLLISRVDAIGDVVLTLPLLGLLKQAHPQMRVTFLGRGYTRAVLEACVHVDAIVDFDELEQLPEAEQIRTVAALNCDAVLHVFPHRAVAKLCDRVGIARRLGTAHRWYHVRYCNRLTMMGRSRTAWHEAQLNVQLAQRLGLLVSDEHNEPPALQELAQYYGLSVSAYWPEGLSHANTLPTSLSIPADSGDRYSMRDRRVIVHPGSRGSARNWPITHFVELVERLLAEGAQVYVTGTEAEGVGFRRDFAPVFERGALDMTGCLSLEQLLGFIQAADALVAASTGPLHVAAALGKVALGIYPPLRPMHAGRWGPLGPQAMALTAGDALCTACRQTDKMCACMAAVSPDRVAETLRSVVGK
ncbi:MAG: glycosyltransferase family 9 protein [Gammaproteobacteria bacterium]